MEEHDDAAKGKPAEDPNEELDELSLEDLGAAYARVAAQHDPEAFAAPETDSQDDSGANPAEEEDHVSGGEREDSSDVVSPEAIIEGALFVGHPENKPLTEQRLASLMRDVTPDEVDQIVEELNQSYRAADQAFRIVRDDMGYRMTIAPEVEGVRRSFLGKVREARLTQAAIEVLSLVAYQPGITAQKVQDQRGRESGSLLNQLVRRQLLTLERKPPEEGGKKVPHYYPTERFLVLFGLRSLDDLPQVEEGLREGDA